MRRLWLALAFVLVACPAFAQDSTHALPPLPKTAPTILGPIAVQVVPNLMCNNAPALGCFDGDERYLAVRDSMPLVVQWQALYHELVHATFYYAGMQFKSEEVADRFADIIANARVHELVAGWPR